MSTVTDQYLHEHRAWNWQWPVDGNCFDTRLTVVQAHPNAHKCNFTPLPGCACARAKRKRQALASSSRRARAS